MGRYRPTARHAVDTSMGYIGFRCLVCAAIKRETQVGAATTS